LYEIEITFPTSTQQIIRWTENVIIAHLADHPVSIIFMEHIASNTAIVFPIQALISLCHSYGIICIVDGAHAVWHYDLYLDELNADIYVGNAHKWLCNPKGSGFLAISQSLLSKGFDLQSPTISHGYQSGGLLSDFI